MPENQAGTLEAISIELAKVFEPFKERVEAGEILLLLAELGLEFPQSLANDTSFQNALDGVTTEINKFPGLVKSLIDAIKAEDYGLAVEKAANLIEIIANLVKDFEAIATAIDANAPYPDLSPADINNFVSELAENIVDYLVINYLHSSVLGFALFLEFFGLIEQTTQNEGSTNPAKPEYTKKKLRLDRLPMFLKSPAALAEDIYGWGSNSLDAEKLFKILGQIFNQLGWPAVYENTSGPELDLLLARLVPRTDLNPHGIDVVVDEKIGGGISQTWSQDNWSFEVGFASSLAVNTGLTIKPSGINIKPPEDSGLTVEGDAYVKWTARDSKNNEPLLLFGQTQGSRLEAKEISALLSANLDWDVVAKEADAGVTFEAEIKEGKLVIKPGDPDGFLAQVLPPEGFTLDFDILLGLNSDKGFYFKGSGTLEFDIPLAINIGPISILNLTVGLSPGSEFKINTGADIKTELGPFVAVVENMGMSTTLSFPQERNGNLGPAQLDIGFKPPNGIGLSLDAEVVKGGGYLMLDHDKGQYAGALELDFKGLFGFTAIGIVTTQFPDGSEGFSLLLLVNVTFNTPISLGFNFYLGGIGGLIGLHRTMKTLALQQGVKDGSIENIMFPENVIANINKIISDLEAIYPAKQDQFVLGIMARITWNTPAVLIIDAGIVVEFPSPTKIAILGVIRCALPTPEEAIIKLNVAFVGIIDFDNKILMFDASIFDSRILTITLEGDMALRVSWGDKPDFLVSVGGFHPVYSPPKHLKLLAMKRMTVNILSGNPNLVLTAYFAVTTNTIQFGAALDFSFKVSKFGIYGKFGFDVLIQFSPFRFIAAVSASVAVKLGSSTLFSIGLSFNLEGPTPWRAHGYASFKLLFIKVKVKFDETWGEKRENTLPAASVLPMLLEEVNKDENWNSIPPAQLPELIIFADSATSADNILVKPGGSLEINQKVVPLDLTLQRFGNYKPDDISKSIITGLSLGGEILTDDELSNLKNDFAPAAYKQMEDEDKLDASSYVKQKSGVRITATDGLDFDYGINRLVQYETVVSDFEEEPHGLINFDANFFKTFISGGDVGKSTLSKEKKFNKEKAGKTVSLAKEQYAVVSSKDLSNAHDQNLVFDSKAEADEYLKTTLQNDSSKKGKIQLSPVYEMI